MLLFYMPYIGISNFNDSRDISFNFLLYSKINYCRKPKILKNEIFYTFFVKFPINIITV